MSGGGFRINHLQLSSDNPIAVGKRLPVDGMSIDEGSESRTRVLDEMAAFPGLKAEMDGGETKVSSDGHFIGGICANADGSVWKEESMALGSAEFSHESGEYYKSSGKLRFSKGQFIWHPPTKKASFP